MTNINSLKSAIIFRLIIPILLFIIILESLFSYFVTLHNVQETYDRWLLDSARSLQQEIKATDGKVSVQLSDTALKFFKWNDVDSIYFKIQTESQGVLVGDLPLRDSTMTYQERPMLFSNIFLNGEELRMVSLIVSNNLPEKVSIHVAETLNARRKRHFELLIMNLAPQLALTILIGLLLYKGVNKGLAPLHKLADDIASRSPSDLSPIPDSHVFAEVKTLTDTINHLFAQLSDSISAQQRFVSNAAHQLRTPLAGLTLQAERAQREDRIETMRPALNQIQHSADKISHMISQLLVLARSSQSEQNHLFETFDFLELAKSICMEWVPKALDKNISLSFEANDHSLMIRANLTLLRELLINLLDNAIKYGHKNGHIQVSIQHQPRPLCIIEDDGPGIKQTEMSRVFERFYRIPSHQQAGCGLGLAIVKEIADLHQYHIEMQASELGGVKIILDLNQSEWP